MTPRQHLGEELSGCDNACCQQCSGYSLNGRDRDQLPPSRLPYQPDGTAGKSGQLTDGPAAGRQVQLVSQRPLLLSVRHHAETRGGPLVPVVPAVPVVPVGPRRRARHLPAPGRPQVCKSRTVSASHRSSPAHSPAELAPPMGRSTNLDRPSSTS